MANKQITFETFMLSTDRQLSFQREVAYTNDVNSVQLSFDIKDLDDLAAYTPNVLLYMRDGSFYQITDGITKTGTTVSYTLKGNEGKHNGVVRVQLVLIDGDKDLASAKHEFRIETGLDNVVATEVMIQDWTTLVKEARDFLDAVKDVEAARVQAESNRVDAESSRVTAETARETAETTRKEQETSRVNAETARVELFQDMQLTQDLDTNKSYKTTLEIYNGRPRLKLEEV